MMNAFAEGSLFFGMTLSVGAFLAGLWLRRRFSLSVVNPLVIAIAITMAALLLLDINYASYERSAKYLGYLLTPATVCLAIPLYKQRGLLVKCAGAIAAGISASVVVGAAGVYLLSSLFGMDRSVYLSLLPKHVTTAIGMGISAEIGGIVTLTILSIVVSGNLGNIFASRILALFKIKDPVAQGLAIGASSHAIGTVRAMELGEVQGAMSSLAMAVAGLVTVVAAPLAAALY